MKRTQVVIAVATLTAIGLVYFQLQPDVKTGSVAGDADVLVDQALDQPNQRDTSQQALSAPSNIGTAVQDNRAFEDSIAAIAAEVVETFKYPEHSIPLEANQYDLLNPNSSSFTDRPYDLGGVTARIRVETDHFRYASGDQIQGSFEISAGSDFFDLVEAMTLSLRTAERTTVFNVDLESDVTQQSFEIPTDGAEAGEYLVGLDISLFGEDDLYQSAPVELIEYIALFKGVGDAFTTPNELHIPTDIEFNNEGFHRIRANLFDSNGAPVAHLQEKLLVTPATSSPPFRVSGALLFDRQASPPYTLEDVQIEYISADPIAAPGFGEASAETYIVDVDLDIDVFAEAVDELSEDNIARLQFIETITNQQQ